MKAAAEVSPHSSRYLAAVANGTGLQERVLLYLKYVDDKLAAETNYQAKQTGVSLRILARTEPDGRRSATLAIYHRMHRQRASGKVFNYWERGIVNSVSWTKRDLLVERQHGRRYRSYSRHIFDLAEITDTYGPAIQRVTDWVRDRRRALTGTGEIQLLRNLRGPRNRRSIDQAIELALQELASHLGDAPSWPSRFPLLAHRHDGPGTGNDYLAGTAYLPFLDADNYAEVAKNLFGKTRYVKPLGGVTAKLHPNELVWYSLFRGLVPTDWLVDAMRDRAAKLEVAIADAQQTARARKVRRTALPNEIARRRVSLRDVPDNSLLRQIRGIFRRTPETVLKRILFESPAQACKVLTDAATVVASHGSVRRELDLLPGLIAARGQRRIRNSRDLEHLVDALPGVAGSGPSRSHVAKQTVMKEYADLDNLQFYNEQVQELSDDITRRLQNGETVDAQIALAAQLPPATWADWQNCEFRERVQPWCDSKWAEQMAEEDRLLAQREERQRLDRLAREQGRHRWAVALTEQLDGREIDLGAGTTGTSGTVTLVVARDGQTLSTWGAAMNHCIGSYANELGLNVFLAVIDAATETMVLNLELHQDDGVQQMLGKNNRDAARVLSRERAQALVDALIRLGVPVPDDALGTKGLQVGARYAAHLLGRDERSRQPHGGSAPIAS